MPRKAQKIDTILTKGNIAHKTKNEIEVRQENNLNIGTDKIFIPKFVTKEKEAKRLWNILQSQLVEKKLLNNFTAPAFAILCDAWAKYCKASEEVREKGITIEKETNLKKVHTLENGKIETESISVLIQNPAVSIMARMAELIKKYSCEFYLTPAAIASYAKNSRSEKPEDPFLEFDQ